MEKQNEALRNRFCGHYFDADTLELVSSKGTRKRLRPMTLRVFFVLARCEGRVVEKNSLLNEVWSDRCVSEGTLTKSIGEIRKAINDHEKTTLRTITKWGFQLVKDVDDALCPS